VTRRGATVVNEPGSASAEWQRAIARARESKVPGAASGAVPPPWEPEVWVEVDTDVDFPDEQPPTAERDPSPGRPRTKRPRRLPADVVAELDVGERTQVARNLQRRLTDAARAYEAERYSDALRLLKPLAESAPTAAAVRELHGLTLYRLGRWRPALKELEAAHELGGSFDQHPVMADCQRALGRYQAVDKLWDDLRRASPSAEVMAEGRMVAAGALADRGNVAAAIGLLERLGLDRARPKVHHLRCWYALGDLYERAGDVPRARELFRRIMRHDAAFHDVAQRLAAL
jgi:tetratricopeptide (TPR) repeat protein